MPLSVLLRTALSPHSGYGRDGIELALSLAKQGHSVYIEPLSTATPIPRQISAILSRETPPACDLMITHADPQTIAEHPLLPHHKRHTARAAWTMWEVPWWPTPRHPRQTTAAAGLTWVPNLPLALDAYDAILAYDDTSRQAIGPALADHVLALLAPPGTPPNPTARERLYQIHDGNTADPKTWPLRVANHSHHVLPQIHPDLAPLAPRTAAIASAARLRRPSDPNQADVPGADRNILDLLQDALTSTAAKLHTVQGGLTPPTYPEATTGLPMVPDDPDAPATWPSSPDGWSPDHPLRLLHASELNDRKNPALMVEAVSLARERGLHVTLTLKGSSYNAASVAKAFPTSKHPFITHTTKLTSRQALLNLMVQHHAGIYPSLGEGKNLPALEAMCLGRPQILSQVGGHNMYADTTNSYPVPAIVRTPERLVQVSATTCADAIEAMYNDPRQAKERGLTAARTIPTACSWERATQRLLDKLRSQGLPL
jgi:glycosyltransferase involved in cell wall biosynthesis